MADFRWTPTRLNRVRAAVRAWNAAITRRERELRDAGMGTYVWNLPGRRTVEQVMGRIHTVNDFRRIVGYSGDARRRPSEMQRILRTVRPDALELTMYQGAVTTNFGVRQRRADEIAIRREAARRRRLDESVLYDGDVGRDMSRLSAPRRGVAQDGNDLVRDDAGVRDESVVDVDRDTLERWRQEDASAKRYEMGYVYEANLYLDVWMNPLNFHNVMGRYEEMIQAIDWMQSHRPDVLSKMFDSGRDELDPQYITESGGTSNPYVNIPYETRHMRAVQYVTGMARRAGWDG